MLRRQVLLGLGLFVIAGCSEQSNDTEPSPTTAPSPTPTSPQLARLSPTDSRYRHVSDAIDFESTTEFSKGDAYRIEGVIRNISEATLFDLVAKAQFYDDDADRLGTGQDSTSELPPGETWRFAISYQGPNQEAITSWGVIVSYDFSQSPPHHATTETNG